MSFSGGVDSIVLGALAAEEGVCEAFADVSFHFPSQEAEIREIAGALGLRLEARRPFEDEGWIAANAEHLFPPAQQFATGNFTLGYASAVQAPHDYAMEKGCRGVLAGLTKAQNGLQHPMLEFESGIQTAYPLFRFERKEVFDFLRGRGIGVPRSYESPLVSSWVRAHGKGFGYRTGSYVETYSDAPIMEQLELVHAAARFWGDGGFAPADMLARFPFLRGRV